MSQIEKTIVENQNEINKFLVKLFEEKNKVKLFEEKNKVKKRKASKMIYHFNVLGETYNSDIFVDNYRDFLLNVSKILDCNKFEILPNGYFKKNKYEFTKSYRKSSIVELHNGIFVSTHSGSEEKLKHIEKICKIMGAKLINL